MCSKPLSLHDESFTLFLTHENNGYKFFGWSYIEQDSILTEHSQFTLGNRIRSQSFHVPCFNQWISAQALCHFIEQRASGLATEPTQVCDYRFFQGNCPRRNADKLPKTIILVNLTVVP